MKEQWTVPYHVAVENEKEVSILLRLGQKEFWLVGLDKKEVEDLAQEIVTALNLKNNILSNTTMKG